MSGVDTSGAAIQAAMADPDPVQVLRLLGALAAERDRLARMHEQAFNAAVTAQAERDALRAECDTLQAERDVACNRHLAAEAERDAARAEVERLREIARKFDVLFIGPESDWRALEALRTEARAALADPQP